MAGIAEGDIVKATFERGKIVLTSDRTQASFRFDASLAEAIKRPYYGSFKNGTEVAAFLKDRQKHARSGKSKTT